jgi:hypothetical protein
MVLTYFNYNIIMSAKQELEANFNAPRRKIKQAITS